MPSEEKKLHGDCNIFGGSCVYILKALHNSPRPHKNGTLFGLEKEKSRVRPGEKTQMNFVVTK